MKKIIIATIVALGLAASANATTCVDTVNDAPLYGKQLEAVSTVKINQENPGSCIDRDSTHVSFETTLGTSFGSLVIPDGGNEMGVAY